MAKEASAPPRFDVRPHPAPLTDEARAAAMSDPGFGTVFTDHIVRMTWDAERGWADRRVEPTSDLTLHPGAVTLHYGQQAFEGLKAYRHSDGSIWLFRPEENAARFAASARRLALPEVSEEDFLGAIEALLAVDGAWVPSGGEASLYLRPLMLGTEPCLSVRPSATVEFFLMACPVGAYFSGGVKPVSTWVAKGFHRAGPGGTGTAKFGGNYAASLLPQQQAYAAGCEQVLFLDAATDTLIEELGGMNVFVVRADGTVETPRLTGTILEGVTRESVIRLLRDGGATVVERDIPMAELLAGIASGDVTEVFACGTAAVVTPLGRLKGLGLDAVVADGTAGAVTMGVREALTGIQYGRVRDPYGWMRRVDQ